MLAAVAHAETVLSWREHLDKDEMPPEYLWPFSEECSAWISSALEARKDKYGGSDSTGSSTSTRNELLD